VRNVRHGVDPRSIAASSSVQSNPRTRACTVSATKLTQNMMWAMTTVVNPSSTLALKNRVNSDEPSTISGVVRGRTMMMFTSPRRRNW
jgi:hypothetical protein